MALKQVTVTFDVSSAGGADLSSAVVEAKLSGIDVDISGEFVTPEVVQGSVSSEGAGAVVVYPNGSGTRSTNTAITVKIGNTPIISETVSVPDVDGPIDLSLILSATLAAKAAGLKASSIAYLTPGELNAAFDADPDFAAGRVIVTMEGA